MSKNCCNSRTDHDIGMNFGTVTKFDKENTSTSKKFDDDVMSINYDVIVLSLIYRQCSVIWKPDSEFMIYKTYIFINSNVLFYRH